MKKILVFVLLAISVAAWAQTYTYVNIVARPNSIGSAAIVNVYLNDELAGRVTELENLNCKLFSSGRITITVTYPEAYMRRSSNIDIEKGKTYYLFITSSYSVIKGTEEEFKNLHTETGKNLKFEEDRHSPVVKSTNTDDEGPKQGTGFLVSKKGYVLTNYHVVRNAKSVQLKGVGGDFSTLYGIDVVAVDVDNDLALLKFKNPNMLFDEPPYALAKTITGQGAKAFVLGYPLATSMGEEIKLTDGLISAKSGYKGSLSQYQFSAPIQPGNSGSPLFNEAGDVIGIANAKLESAESAGYAIKSQYIYTFLSLIDNFSYTPGMNQVKALSLNEKVSKLKNFIYIIKTESE
ncbi:MAG: serine protease [Chitinophagales bacterium]